jgi:hypothetical protein
MVGTNLSPTFSYWRPTMTVPAAFATADADLEAALADLFETTADEALTDLVFGFVLWNVTGDIDPAMHELHERVAPSFAAPGKDVTSLFFDDTTREADEPGSTLPHKGEGPGFELIDLPVFHASTAAGAEVVVVTDGRGELPHLVHPNRWTFVLLPGAELESELHPDVRVVKM